MKVLHRRIPALVLLLAATSAQAFDFNSLLTGWISSYNQKVAALKVVAKQNSVATDKLVAAYRETNSAAITAFVVNRQAETVRGAVQRFSDQGIFPCYQNDISTQVSQTSGRAWRASQDASARIQAADFGSASARRADQMALHKAVYCSVSEHKAGLCKINAMGLQSADSDFAFLVKTGTKSSSERSAGYDFVDNIVPPRAQEKCSGSQCAAVVTDGASMNAFDSLARQTLVSLIESRSSQVNTN